MSPRRRRDGATILVIGFLIVVLALGVFMLQRAMRQRHWESHRHTSGEVATYLAESGLNIVWENVWENLERREGLFYDLLVDTPAEDLDGQRLDLENPHLAEATGPLGGDADLEVSVSFEGVRAFTEGVDLRGISRDLREKYGTVVLEARGTYRGVSRIYTARRNVKVVDTTVPILSKFTLFVRSQGDQEVNSLAYDRVQPGAALEFDGGPARPLVLFHGADAAPTVAEGVFYPTGPLFQGQTPDAGGLVFLGGGDPWYLNLVHGTGLGPFDELFHLRRARHMTASSFPEIRSEQHLWFGFYDGLLTELPLRGRPGLDPTLRRPGGEPIAPGTSVLHLYGDVQAVSPTPVLGPVYRSYVRAPLMDGIWYPYYSREEFAGLGSSVVFAGEYEKYARVMTRIEHEPYTRSYDYIVTNTETLDPEGAVSTDGETWVDPPAHLLPEALSRIGPAEEGDEHFLYPTPGDPALGQIRMDRVMGDGDREELFRGALEDIDGALLQDLLRAKAVVRCADQEELFSRFVRDGKLDPAAIALVEAGGLQIGKRTVGRSSMILVEGDIEVTGWLAKSEPGHVLSLVSLGGNIRVATGAQVQAHLVALDGTISFNRGQIEIRGGLAAGTLDFESMVKGSEPKWLTYDLALDPTLESGYRNHLRAVLDGSVGLSLKGGGS